MTACPVCAAKLDDSVYTCSSCGADHIIVRDGTGKVIQRLEAQHWIVGASPEAPPALNLSPSEIVAEPITAFRIWEIDNDVSAVVTPDVARKWASAWEEGQNPFREFAAPWLGGVGVDSLWARPFTTAECSPPGGVDGENHESPRAECRCGIWALKDEALTRDVLARYPKTMIAWGSVLLWGRIVETEIGYRAQYAQPLSITVHGITQEEADEIALVYECEVTRVEEMPELPLKGKTIVQATQNFSLALQNLQASLGAAMTPAISSASTAAAQLQAAQQKALIAKLKAAVAQSNPPMLIVPAQFPDPKRGFFRWLGGVFLLALFSILSSPWFMLGCATLNTVFFAVGHNPVSAFAAAMCWGACFFRFKALRRIAKFLILVIPICVCAIVWAILMGSACFIDWVRQSPKPLSEGPAEAWVWKHDPLAWFEKDK